MVNSPLLGGTLNSKFEVTLVTSLFIFFLYLCFVGLLPFGPRQPYVLEETGAGDLIIQISYLASASIISFIAIQRLDLRFLKVISIFSIVAIFWALLSFTWSEFPVISIRRTIFTVLIIFSIYIFVGLLGPLKAFKILFYTLLTLVFASILSAQFVPNAVHREGMRGSEDLIGLWRGVFIHKNEAGSAAAFLLILSILQVFFGGIIKSKPILWFSVICSIILLIFAYSKTCIYLVGPAIILSSVHYFFVCRRSIKVRLLFFILLISCSLVATIILYNSNLLYLIEDPDAFTGRANIWHAVVGMISDKPYLGFGYGSIYEVGYNTPLRDYGNEWVILAAHSHSGYLQIAADLGIIGLVLIILGFIVSPFVRTIFSQSVPKELIAPFFGVTIFFIFHNIFETSLFYRDATEWVIFVVILSCTQYYLEKQVKDNNHF